MIKESVGQAFGQVFLGLFLGFLSSLIIGSGSVGSVPLIFAIAIVFALLACSIVISEGYEMRVRLILFLLALFSWMAGALLTVIFILPIL